MPQFDVFKNTNKNTKKLYPYLIELQCDFLRDLQTTVVVPLSPQKDYQGTPLSNLHPVIKISNKNL